MTARLAAVVFDKHEEPDPPLRAFVAARAAEGRRIAGLVQERCEDDGCDLHDVRVRDLATDATLPIMQNLGAASEGCRVDPAAIAAAASLLQAARRAKPDLLIVNRFGRLESEGGGMIAEIAAAAAEGEPLVICVPLRYLDAWNAFAGGLDAQLAPERAALDAWWSALTTPA